MYLCTLLNSFYFLVLCFASIKPVMLDRIISVFRFSFCDVLESKVAQRSHCPSLFQSSLSVLCSPC